MKTAVTAALLLGLVMVTPAHSDQFLADFQGYDWTWPLANRLDATGQYYEANAMVGSVNPIFLNYDFVNNEYTVMIGDNLFFASADTFGTTVVAHFTNGKIYLICDSKTTGTPATYDFQSQCDPFYDRLTFVDGDTTLCGVFTSFDAIYDMTTGDGNIAGYTNWQSGSQLGNIPPSQRSGWTLGAIGIRSGAQGHCGYHWQIDGNCVLQEPVPVENTTWGSIKSGSFEIKR